MTNGRTRAIINGRLRDQQAVIIDSLRSRRGVISNLIGEIDKILIEQAANLTSMEAAEAQAYRDGLMARRDDIDNELAEYGAIEQEQGS